MKGGLQLLYVPTNIRTYIFKGEYIHIVKKQTCLGTIIGSLINCLNFCLISWLSWSNRSVIA